MDFIQNLYILIIPIPYTHKNNKKDITNITAQSEQVTLQAMKIYIIIDIYYYINYIKLYKMTRPLYITKYAMELTPTYKYTVNIKVF